MHQRNWPKIVLLASWAPTALLVIYILWFALVFRPSGQEAWGDGATIFYVGALCYPLSVALLIIGAVLAVRSRTQHPGKPSAGPLLFAASWFQLFLPFVVLLAAASYGGA